MGQLVFNLITNVDGECMEWLIFFDRNGYPHCIHDYEPFALENQTLVWRCDEDEGSFPFVDNVEGVAFNWRKDNDYRFQIDMFIGDKWFEIYSQEQESYGPLHIHAVRQKEAVKLQAMQEAVQAKLYQEFESLPVTSTRRCFQSISRNGQPKMRQELLDEFKSTCPATGETHETYLEAAHLVPFRDIHHCESDNGLLLDLKIHKALDSGHLTYDGNGQLWRQHNFDIRHLHICNAQLPSRLLTYKRKKWLEQAYRGWLTHHNRRETELCKVII